MDAEDTPDDGLSLKVDEVVTPVAIAFIIFGVSLLILCIVGCCGACCGFKKCMIVVGISRVATVKKEADVIL